MVGEGEEAAAQRRIHRQLIVWPLDGAERDAQRIDLLALVKAAAAHQQVWHLPSLQGVDVGTRDVGAPAGEPTEQDRHVSRLHRHTDLAATRRPLGHRPAALLYQPLDEGADGVGQRGLDGLVADVA